MEQNAAPSLSLATLFSLLTGRERGRRWYEILPLSEEARQEAKRRCERYSLRRVIQQGWQRPWTFTSSSLLEEELTLLLAPHGLRLRMSVEEVDHFIAQMKAQPPADSPPPVPEPHPLPDVPWRLPVDYRR